jgi:hypothetical protein
LVYRDEHENRQGEIAGWVAEHISPPEGVGVQKGSGSVHTDEP